LIVSDSSKDSRRLDMPDQVTLTKMLALVMDVTAVLMDQKHRYTEFLEGIDDAIAIDLRDDAEWKEAEDDLMLAIELEEPLAKQGLITKALAHLRNGMQIDFGDLTKEHLKKRIVPDEEAIERLQVRCGEMTVALEGMRRQRRGRSDRGRQRR